MSQKDGRRREKIDMFLDLKKREQLILYQEIETLKAKRRFGPMWRDGLRLILSLKRGDTSVLEELFPGLLDNSSQLLSEIRNLVNDSQPRYLGPVQFSDVEFAETRTTEQYIAEVFDDLDSLGI